MTKKSKILLIAIVAIGFCSCKKQQQPKTPVEILTSKSWRYVDWSEDKNPSTNPNNIFLWAASVGDYEGDDRLIFGKDGILTTHRGEIRRPGENEIDHYPYFYDAVNNTLTIDNGRYEWTYIVLEISSEQIKYMLKVFPDDDDDNSPYVVSLLQ